MHAYEEFLGQTLLPLEKAAQDQELFATGEVNLGVIAGRKDGLNPLHLHDFEVMVDRQEQTVIDGEWIVAGHTP